MLVHRRVTPSIKFAGTHLYTWVKRGTVRVKCLAQEHNTMSQARARSRTTRSGDERTNREATAPPTEPHRLTKQYLAKKNISLQRSNWAFRSWPYSLTKPNFSDLGYVPSKTKSVNPHFFFFFVFFGKVDQYLSAWQVSLQKSVCGNILGANVLK